MGRSGLQTGPQIKRNFIGRQIFDDVQRGAAQGKRVVGAFGRQSGGEETGQTIQPVGQG